MYPAPLATPPVLRTAPLHAAVRIEDRLTTWLVQRLASVLVVAGAPALVAAGETIATDLWRARGLWYQGPLMLLLMLIASVPAAIGVVLRWRPSWTALALLVSIVGWLIGLGCVVGSHLGELKPRFDPRELVPLQIATATLAYVATLAASVEPAHRGTWRWPWLIAVVWACPIALAWLDGPPRGVRGTWFAVSKWDGPSLQLFAEGCAATLAATWAMDRNGHHRAWLGRACLVAMACAGALALHVALTPRPVGWRGSRPLEVVSGVWAVLGGAALVWLVATGRRTRVAAAAVGVAALVTAALSHDWRFFANAVLLAAAVTYWFATMSVGLAFVIPDDSGGADGDREWP